jgi:hypothetical protein
MILVYFYEQRNYKNSFMGFVSNSRSNIFSRFVQGMALSCHFGWERIVFSAILCWWYSGWETRRWFIAVCRKNAITWMVMGEKTVLLDLWPQSFCQFQVCRTVYLVTMDNKLRHQFKLPVVIREKYIKSWMQQGLSRWMNWITHRWLSWRYEIAFGRLKVYFFIDLGCFYMFRFNYSGKAHTHHTRARFHF